MNLFNTPVFLYRNAEQWSTLNFIIIRKTKTNCSELCHRFFIHFTVKIYQKLCMLPRSNGLCVFNQVRGLRSVTGELHSTPSGSNPVLDLFYIRPPSASTYYDENPIKWVMHGVYGVYSTNSYFSFLFSFDVLTHNGHFCLLGLFLSLDYVYIITGIQLFVKGLKESFLNITKSIC